MPSSPSTKYYRAKAFVFDLDGTLIDTIPLVEKFWHQFAFEHGLDGNKILATSHGVRTIETMAKWTPHKATPEHADDFERKLAEESEGVSVLPGISTLLQKIPHGKWGICTGGNEYMARKRLEQCDIQAPEAMVCGDMPQDVIVFEDAPAGVKAAISAGAQVIACTTTHTVDQLREAGAHTIVKLLTDVDFTNLPDGSFEVEVKSTL
ncbi:unnamed protein product [Mucor circinelloides]